MQPLYEAIHARGSNSEAKQQLCSFLMRVLIALPPLVFLLRPTLLELAVEQCSLSTEPKRCLSRRGAHLLATR